MVVEWKLEDLLGSFCCTPGEKGGWLELRKETWRSKKMNGFWLRFEDRPNSCRRMSVEG